MNRRSFMLRSAVITLASPMLAVSQSTATALATTAVNELNRMINSRGSGQSLHNSVLTFFRKYSDVRELARSAIGAPWRQMTDSQQSEYVSAFETYVVRKYARQFNSLRGASVEILGTNGDGSGGYKVTSQFIYSGSNPYKVVLHVRDTSSGARIMDLAVQGVSLVSTERAVIRRRLANAGNSIDLFIKLLKNA